MEWRRDGYEVSDERSRLDRAAVRRFIAEESYWAAGIPQGVMDKAIDNSLCFGLFRGDAHGLHTPHGFRSMADPTRYLEIHRPDVYRTARGGSPCPTR